MLSSATFFMVAGDKPATGQEDPMTTPELADSIRAVKSETLRLHEETAQNLDSVARMSAYLKMALASHDYRVYRYSNPRVKLVYKWRRGSPGHWELIRKIFY